MLIALIGLYLFEDFSAQNIAMNVQHVQKLTFREVVLVNRGVGKALYLLTAFALEALHQLGVSNPPSQRPLGIKNVGDIDKDVHLAVDK